MATDIYCEFCGKFADFSRFLLPVLLPNRHGFLVKFYQERLRPLKKGVSPVTVSRKQVKFPFAMEH